MIRIDMENEKTIEIKGKPKDVIAELITILCYIVEKTELSPEQFMSKLSKLLIESMEDYETSKVTS